MKTPLLLSLVLAASTLRADLLVTYEIEPPGRPAMTMVLQAKDGKLRSDSGKDVSAIINASTGDVITLMHPNKMAMKAPAAALQAAKDAALKAAADAKPGPPTATGEKETITGFACEKYIWTGPEGAKLEIWITKDVSDARDLLRQLAGLGDHNTASLLAPEEIDGFPIRTKVVEGPGTGMVMTVVGLSRDPLPDSLFEIPAGYREMQIPSSP
jgi:hypothetical protein